jgi:hypothetical protein
MIETITQALKIVKNTIDGFATTTEARHPFGGMVPCVRLSYHPSDEEVEELGRLGLRETTPMWAPNDGTNGRHWYLPA